jgi:hypothetical protein
MYLLAQVSNITEHFYVSERVLQKHLTTLGSIQLCSSGWVRKLPDTSTQLDEGRNDLTDKI